MAKNKSSKKTKRRGPRNEPLVGCAFGAAGCDGERVHDWPRAISNERLIARVRDGQVRLCDGHRRCVNTLLKRSALPLSGPVDEAPD